MLFNSLTFLYLFLPITYFVFWRLTSKRPRYVWLAVTGYIFYGFWSYKFCALMAFSTVVSYLAGRGLLAFEDARRRKLCLVLPITVDLLLLGFFKYAGFAIETLNSGTTLLGIHHHLAPLNLVVPVGISFYTFHTITYVVDGYRRVIKPTRDFFEFACYVSLFAQLVAGPIVRFRQIEGDLENIDHANRVESLDRGWSFFALGLIKKVLIADSIAKIINPVLADAGPEGTVATWLCVLGYTYQLYFDFSGYSDMAVGLGHLFGLRLPQNFDSPYKAIDPSDFWRRWHISLSTMMRDYLYIPLGGDRTGVAKTYRNLLVTMLLGGLWHGASWNFVVWGGLHGLGLAVHKSIGGTAEARGGPLRRAGSTALTFLFVCLCWVFFRSSSFATSWLILRKLAFLDSVGVHWIYSPFWVLAPAVAVWHFLRSDTNEHGEIPLLSLGGWVVLWSVAYLLWFTAPLQAQPFIYFQF
jgi:alginate O-acetyltransferase complex protein AlgI